MERGEYISTDEFIKTVEALYEKILDLEYENRQMDKYFSMSIGLSFLLSISAILSIMFLLLL